MGKKADSVLDSPTTPAPPYEELFHNHSEASHSDPEFTPATTFSTTSSPPRPFHQALSSLAENLGIASKPAYAPVAQSDVEAAAYTSGEDASANADAQNAVPLQTLSAPHVHCKECSRIQREREGRRCCLNCSYAFVALVGMIVWCAMIFGIVAVKYSHRKS